MHPDRHVQASPPDAPAAPASGFPAWPLAVTMAMQTLATMAVFAVPSMAPAIVRDLGVNGALTGYFVSIVYGVGIGSSLLAADLIHRFGPVRVTQGILVAAVAMLLICSTGSVAGLALGAMALGSAYGATAPVSAHLLVPRTPPNIVNLVLSIRQLAVPLAGVLAALVMPPLALRLSWQSALLTLVAPIIVLTLVLELPRRTWDGSLPAGARWRRGSVRKLGEMLARNPALRRLTFASFVFSGVQLCFVAFIAVQLTSRVGFGLVAAGQALALFQLCGVVFRPGWGWVADHWIPVRWLLVGLGCSMGVAAGLAATFSPAWPAPLVLLVCALAGVSANGFTGIAYAEFARLGGAYRTEATGLGSAAMFTGVLVMPSVGAALVTLSGSYLPAFGLCCVLGLTAGIALARRSDPDSGQAGA